MNENKKTIILNETKRRLPSETAKFTDRYCCICGKTIHRQSNSNRYLLCDKCRKENHDNIQLKNFRKRRCRVHMAKHGESFHDFFQEGDAMPCYQCGKMLVYDGIVEHLVCPRCRVNPVQKNKDYLSYSAKHGFLFNKDLATPVGKKPAKRAFELVEKQNTNEREFIRKTNVFLGKYLTFFWAENKGISKGDVCYCNRCGSKIVYPGNFTDALCENCKRLKDENKEIKEPVDKKDRDAITVEYMSEETFQAIKKAAKDNHRSFLGVFRMIVKDYVLEEREKESEKE